MTSKATRREFCRWVAGGTAWAIGGTAGLPWANSRVSDESAKNSDVMDQARVSVDDLLTNPRYAVGAKFRLGQFIQRGADPKDAEAIFRRLTDLEPQRWVEEWTRLAQPWEKKGAEFAAQGKSQEAKEAYQ